MSQSEQSEAIQEYIAREMSGLRCAQAVRLDRLELVENALLRVAAFAVATTGGKQSASDKAVARRGQAA